MFKILGLEHLTALKQTEVLGGLLDISEGGSGSNQKDVPITRNTRRCPSKYSTPIGLGYEELGGLLDPGRQDCAHRIDMKKIPDTHKEGKNCNPPRTLLCNPPGTPTL